MAAHHSYIEVTCPVCKQGRTARKDFFTKLAKQGRPPYCTKCAPRSKTKKKKAPKELKKNQGAYSSYNKAKQRVATNHQNAYSHVEFRFESYEQFLAEMGPRPEGKTLDRINVNGHYEPGNVRWATHKQQCRNKRNNVILEYNGTRMCLEDASKASGISTCALRDRIKNNCPQDLLFYKGRWRYRNGRLANESQEDFTKRKASLC